MVRLFRKQLQVVGGRVLVVLGYWKSWRDFQEFQQIIGSSLVKRIGASAGGTKTVPYNLVEGWNFIVFPVDPVTAQIACKY